MSGLKVAGLTKTLSGAATLGDSAVLRGVDVAIAPGECLGLKGTTGAGKSTLLRIVAGLLTPDSGEVWLEDELLSSPQKSVPPEKRRIGFVFQNLGLWPHLTVHGHLDYVLSAQRLTKDARLKLRGELVQTFMLDGLETRYPAELSGGEKHLLALARAFGTDTRLLLLDEPFTGLDGALKTRILNVLRHERARRGVTTLLVTHDDAEMRALCSRVELLGEGRIAERHAPRALDRE